jgi:hypothetical protein
VLQRNRVAQLRRCCEVPDVIVTSVSIDHGQRNHGRCVALLRGETKPFARFFTVRGLNDADLVETAQHALTRWVTRFGSLTKQRERALRALLGTQSVVEAPSEHIQHFYINLSAAATRSCRRVAIFRGAVLAKWQERSNGLFRPALTGLRILHNTKAPKKDMS